MSKASIKPRVSLPRTRRNWIEGRTLSSIQNLREVWWKFFLPTGDMDEDFRQALLLLFKAWEYLDKYEARLKAK